MRRSIFGHSLLILGFIILGSQSETYAAEEGLKAQKAKGLKIYKELCVECHGDRGQGVKDLCDDPLIGNRSIESLTKRIERTMPEDEEDLCVGPDAKAVALYIYDAFYSSQARAKQLASIKPRLQRLTVPQYKRTVTDLITSFRRNYKNKYSEESVVNMRYSGRHPTKKKNDKKEWVNHRKKVGQINDTIQKTKLPYKDLDQKENIEINYEGSIVAESMGVHELFIQTQNGFSLWLNERDWRADKQIDGSVVSGKEIREMSHKVYMMKGWAYPMRLKWNISKKEEEGSMKLLWKAPGGVKELVPKRVFIPSMGPNVASISTAFPADDASQGYEMGISVSKDWQAAIVKAAIEAAHEVDSSLNEMAQTKNGDKERDDKIKAFCHKFVERALRRPLTEQDKAKFVEEAFKKVKDSAAATKRVVHLTLCSAEFLYPEVGVVQPTQYDVA